MIELVVVMSLIGLLLSIAVPRYMAALERGKHQVLVHNMAQLRRAIDQFHGDRGAFPDRLEDLVERRYLRSVPVNPFTERAEWDTVAPPAGQTGRIYDVRSPEAVAEPAKEQADAPAVRASDAERNGGAEP